MPNTLQLYPISIISTIIILCSCGGGSNKTETTGHAPHPYVIVSNEGSKDISVFKVDDTSGGLISVPGSPFSSPNGAGLAMDVSPSHQYLYIAAPGSISKYSIDNYTGSLTPRGGAGSSGQSPISLRISPNGKFLYISNFNNNNISAFSVDTSSGNLTEVSGSPFPCPSQPYGMEIDAQSKYLMVANRLDNSVSVYSINDINGVITNISNSPFSAITSDMTTNPLPVSVTIDPAFKYLVTSNIQNGTSSIFSIDQSSGKLTLSSALQTGCYTKGAAFHPSGSYLYTLQYTCNTITCATFNRNNGSAIVITSPSIQTGSAPQTIAVSSNGKYLFCSNYNDSTISVFSINSSTGIATIAGPPTPSGQYPSKLIYIDL